MRKARILLITCLAAFAMSSCSESEPVVELPKSTSVKFDASIEKVVTRAFDTTWDATDAIGVYMKTAGGDLTTAAISGAENIKYTTVGGSGNATFSAATTGIELPADGSSVDFIAYYPYKTSINTFECSVDVTNQNTQANIDLLYSNNATAQDKSGAGNVGLNFTHQLAKVIINITAGSGIANLNGLGVKVTGTNPIATFALKDGTLTPTGNATDIPLLLNATNTVAEGIIVPGSTAERTFVFALNGRTFKYTVPAAVTFTKGHKYTYNATLTVDGVTILNPGGTITDWTDAPQGNIIPELEGGGDPGPDPGTRVEFFEELFGDGTSYGSGNRPLIAAMTNWSMANPITYTDSYGKADIRSTTTVSPSVWFPAVSASNPVISELVIGGIDQLGTYTGIKLSYDVAANAFTSSNITHFEVYYATTPGTYVKLADRTETFSANNAFVSITDIDLPDGITELKFYYDANNGGEGYRLDNVVLSGIQP